MTGNKYINLMCAFKALRDAIGNENEKINEACNIVFPAEKTRPYACGLGMTVEVTLPIECYPEEENEPDYFQTYLDQLFITGDPEQAKNRTMIISFNDYINS